MSELPKNVARGVELLDHEYPDWREKIDPDRLDMESCFDCILGQLFEDEAIGTHGSGYYFGLDRLRVSAALHGFTAYGAQRWDNLRDAWVRAISRV